MGGSSGGGVRGLWAGPQPNAVAIGPDGARALAAVLRHNTTLTAVNLADNEVGDGGARALLEALGENHYCPGGRWVCLQLVGKSSGCMSLCLCVHVCVSMCAHLCVRALGV